MTNKCQTLRKAGKVSDTSTISELFVAKQTLYELAVAYVKLIERIERTSDRQQLQKLEEERVVRHNQFADALKAAGIHYKDREHVTRIALRIAKEEL